MAYFQDLVKTIIGKNKGTQTDPTGQFSISRPQNLQTGFTLNSPNTPTATMGPLKPGQAGPVKPSSTPTIIKAPAPKIQLQGLQSVAKPAAQPITTSLATPGGGYAAPVGSSTASTVSTMSKAAEQPKTTSTAPTVPQAPVIPQTPTPPVIAPYGAAGGDMTQPGAYTAPVSDTQKTYNDLVKQYLASLGGTADQSDQDALDAIAAQQAKLNAEAGLGKEAVSEQPIAMPFVTGQQAAIERSLAAKQAALSAQAEPLQTRLAREQAKKTAATDVLSKTLDLTEKQLTREEAAQAKKEEAKKLMSLSAGQSVYNPATGKVEYTAPEKSSEVSDFTLGEGQQRYDASGKLIASGAPKTDTQVIGGYLYEKQPDGTYKQVAGTGTTPEGGKIVKINGVDYQLNPDGTYTQPNVPALKAQASELKTNALTAAKDLLTKFANNKWAVGGTSMMPIVPGSAAADFVVTFDNLKSLLSLDNVKLLKGQGQVSDAERKLLEDASAKLSRSQSEGEFQKQLEDIIKGLSGIGESGGTKGDALDQALGFNTAPSTAQKGLVTEQIGTKKVTVAPTIASKLAQADKEMFAATGTHIAVNQSYRSTAEQAKLYAELKPKGAQVAPPGKSYHEKGLAVDVTNWQAAEPYLRKQGLLNPMANDKGHFSYGEFKA